MTRRWALRLTACLLAGAAALTGCSEKQEASESLPSTSSASPSEDALPPLGPADLPMPDEARTQDAAGAEAFVRYYIELINRTSTVMDAQPLRDFSDGCRDCDRIADNVEADAVAGRTLPRQARSPSPSSASPVLNGLATAEVPHDRRPSRADRASTQRECRPVDGGSERTRDAAGRRGTDMGCRSAVLAHD